MSDIYIHKKALVESNRIGRGTKIWAFTHVMRGALIGANCNIGEHCFVESGAVIGNNVTIKNGTLVWEGVVLEDGVFIGPHVCFTNDLYPRSPRLPQMAARYHSKQWLLPTVVKKGATVGAGVVLLPNVTIGDFAMIGAGAVVVKDVPPYALAVGTPALLRGWVCQCGQPLEFDQDISLCQNCNLSFVKDHTNVSTGQAVRSTGRMVK